MYRALTCTAGPPLTFGFFFSSSLAPSSHSAAMIEKLNAVATAHPGHPVFIVAASFGNRVGVEVLTNRAERLEPNVADALICTGFPLYPEDPKVSDQSCRRASRTTYRYITFHANRAVYLTRSPSFQINLVVFWVFHDIVHFSHLAPKTEAKKFERMEGLRGMKPTTSVLFCSGSKDAYLNRPYLALDARGLDAIREVVEEMANEELVTVVEIEGGKHGVPSGTGYKKRKTTIENEAGHVASAIFNFCKQVERRGVE